MPGPFDPSPNPRPPGAPAKPLGPGEGFKDRDPNQVLGIDGGATIFGANPNNPIQLLDQGNFGLTPLDPGPAGQPPAPAGDSAPIVDGITRAAPRDPGVLTAGVDFTVPPGMNAALVNPITMPHLFTQDALKRLLDGTVKFGGRQGPVDLSKFLNEEQKASLLSRARGAGTGQNALLDPNFVPGTQEAQKRAEANRLAEGGGETPVLSALAQNTLDPDTGRPTQVTSVQGVTNASNSGVGGGLLTQEVVDKMKASNPALGAVLQGVLDANNETSGPGTVVPTDSFIGPGLAVDTPLALDGNGSNIGLGAGGPGVVPTPPDPFGDGGGGPVPTNPTLPTFDPRLFPGAINNFGQPETTQPFNSRPVANELLGALDSLIPGFSQSIPPGFAGFDPDSRGNFPNLGAGAFANDPFELFGDGSAAGLGLNTLLQQGARSRGIAEGAQADLQSAVRALQGGDASKANAALLTDLLANPFAASGDNLRDQVLNAGRSRLRAGGNAALDATRSGAAAAGVRGGEAGSAAGGVQNETNARIAQFEADTAADFGLKRSQERAANAQTIGTAADTTQKTTVGPEALLSQFAQNISSGAANPFTGNFIEALFQIEGLKQAKELGANVSNPLGDIAGGVGLLGSLVGAGTGIKGLLS